MTVFFHVAYSSLFVALVEREDYVEGNSLLAGSRAFSFVAGPSVGGILVQLLKAPYALLVDSISFLFSAGFLASIDPVEPEVEEAEKGHVVAGVRYIVTSSVMRSSLLATATINLFNFVFHALFILYAVRSLNVRPATLGIVLGAGAVGGLIGSVVTSRLGRRIGIGPTYILGCIVFPVPLVLVPLAGGPYWLILAMLFLAEFGAGLGVMILDISAASIFAALVPHRLRSRVSGAYMVVNNGVRPVGSLIGGFLGTAIGLQTTLWIGVVGAAAGLPLAPAVADSEDARAAGAGGVDWPRWRRACPGAGTRTRTCCAASRSGSSAARGSTSATRGASSRSETGSRPGPATSRCSWCGPRTACARSSTSAATEARCSSTAKAPGSRFSARTTRGRTTSTGRCAPPRARTASRTSKPRACPL